MQGGRDPFFGFGDPFGGFGGFGGQRSLISSFFGGRDPFDDPFFRPQFGSMFESSFFGSNGGSFMNSNPSGFLGFNVHNRNPFMNSNPSGFLEFNIPNGGPFMNSNPSEFLNHHPSVSNRSRGPIIEELNSDDEKDEGEDGKEKKVHPRKHGRLSKELIVEDPDDEASAEKKIKHMPQVNHLNLEHRERPQSQTQCFTFQSSSVTRGGSNGAYYSTSSTRRTGTDGLTFEEYKEANSATRKATHKVSRGMHDKGHSFTRKLNSDGHVDEMQTLHNLNEDELVGFEQAWAGNARKHLPGWNERHASQNFIGSASGGNQQPHMRGNLALPSSERSNSVGASKPDKRCGAVIPPRQPGRLKTDMGNGAGSSSTGINGVGRAPHQFNRC